MQFSNMLLLVVAVAAVAVNPLLDPLALALARLFRRLDMSRRRRAAHATRARAVAAHVHSRPSLCG